MDKLTKEQLLLHVCDKGQEHETGIIGEKVCSAVAFGIG